MGFFVFYGGDEAAKAVSCETEYSDQQARQLWQHEDSLIDDRIRWFGLLQGLLFTAYGVSLQASDKTAEKARVFADLVARAGVWIALIVFAGVVSAVVAMYFIYGRSPWRRPGVTWLTSVGGQCCATAVPLVFVFVWLQLLDDTLGNFLRKSASAAIAVLL